MVEPSMQKICLTPSQHGRRNEGLHCQYELCGSTNRVRCRQCHCKWFWQGIIWRLGEDKYFGSWIVVQLHLSCLHVLRGEIKRVSIFTFVTFLVGGVLGGKRGCTCFCFDKSPQQKSTKELVCHQISNTKHLGRTSCPKGSATPPVECFCGFGTVCSPLLSHLFLEESWPRVLVFLMEPARSIQSNKTVRGCLFRGPANEIPIWWGHRPNRHRQFVFGRFCPRRSHALLDILTHSPFILSSLCSQSPPQRCASRYLIYIWNISRYVRYKPRYIMIWLFLQSYIYIQPFKWHEYDPDREGRCMYCHNPISLY